MNNWVNWTLVGCGGLLIVAEVVLGAATGFDLALMGGDAKAAPASSSHGPRSNP